MEINTLSQSILSTNIEMTIYALITGIGICGMLFCLVFIYLIYKGVIVYEGNNATIIYTSNKRFFRFIRSLRDSQRNVKG